MKDWGPVTGEQHDSRPTMTLIMPSSTKLQFYRYLKLFDWIYWKSRIRWIFWILLTRNCHENKANDFRAIIDGTIIARNVHWRHCDTLLSGNDFRAMIQYPRSNHWAGSWKKSIIVSYFQAIISPGMEIIFIIEKYSSSLDENRFYSLNSIWSYFFVEFALEVWLEFSHRLSCRPNDEWLFAWLVFEVKHFEC